MLCATVEPIQPFFPSSYIVESGFIHVHYLLGKFIGLFIGGKVFLRGGTSEYRTNLQPNVRDLLGAHQNLSYL